MKDWLSALVGFGAVIVVTIPITMLGLFLGFSNGGAAFLAGWFGCLVFYAVERLAARRLA